MSPLLITLLVVGLVKSSCSFLLNIFIALETGKDLRNAKASRVDLIQLVMAITNILFTCVLMADNLSLWFPEFYISDLVVLVPLLFLIRFSYWLMALLCASYCTSITRYNHRVFISIKKILSNLLPHLLFLAGIGSIVLTLVYYRHGMCGASEYINGKFNSTEIDDDDDEIDALTNSLDFVFPFTIIMTSLVVMVSSLLNHMWNIGKAGFGQNIQAHVNAARTMMLLLLLSITFFISLIISFMVEYSLDNPLSVICWIVVTIFPEAEGAILIQGSPKLRDMFLTWLSARGTVRFGN